MNVISPDWSHTWKRFSLLFFSSFCLAAAVGTAMAVGTAEARYKLIAVCCAADSGFARIGGVSFMLLAFNFRGLAR
jgi:hypothetical protein